MNTSWKGVCKIHELFPINLASLLTVSPSGRTSWYKTPWWSIKTVNEIVVFVWVLQFFFQVSLICSSPFLPVYQHVFSPVMIHLMHVGWIIVHSFHHLFSNTNMMLFLQKKKMMTLESVLLTKISSPNIFNKPSNNQMTISHCFLKFFPIPSSINNVDGSFSTCSQPLLNSLSHWIIQCFPHHFKYFNSVNLIFNVKFNAISLFNNI